MAAKIDDTEGAEGAELTKTEARQGTRPQAMFWVLWISILLAVIAGILLGFGWVQLT